MDSQPLTASMVERAFPTAEVRDDDLVDKGISKIGYYAAFVMMGLVSRCPQSCKMEAEIAKASVDQAIALIKELESRKMEEPSV